MIHGVRGASVCGPRRRPWLLAASVRYVGVSAAGGGRGGAEEGRKNGHIFVVTHYREGGDVATGGGALKWPVETRWSPEESARYGGSLWAGWGAGRLNGPAQTAISIAMSAWRVGGLAMGAGGRGAGRMDSEVRN